MKNFIQNFTIFIFLTSCGYVPLYNFKNNNINFEIGEVKVIGDKELNRNIISQLKNAKTEKRDSSIIYDLTINSKIERIVTSKDSKGDPKTYKMVSNVTLTTFKDEKEYNQGFSSVENYNDISSKFELENFEKNLKKNSARKITQEIIIYLTTF